MSEQKLFGGLVTRRERLGLSWRGWLLLALIAAGVFLSWLFTIQSFLAQNQPVKSDVLVMEGWIQDYAIRAAANDFMSGPYHKIYSTGGPIVGTAGFTNELNTFASVGGVTLEKDGVPAAAVQRVPAREVGRDRTFTSAVALREWFHARGVKVQSFNLVTEDAHARRSRLLFQEAFGSGVKVGIISIPDPDYDPRQWWKSSEGVRTVLGENIAYLYVRFFFYPPPRPPGS